jgi:hypothetical protein
MGPVHLNTFTVQAGCYALDLCRVNTPMTGRIRGKEHSFAGGGEHDLRHGHGEVLLGI